MIAKSVRELGGELWAEMEFRRQDRDLTLEKLSYKEISELTDFLMRVLVRHAGCIIENDKDLPVEPLPKLMSE